MHVLCLLDGLGRKIWSGSFGADPEGYDRLAEAIGDPGSCMVVGVEGTASYGAGLTRRLVELGYNVVEVLRPKRDKVRPAREERPAGRQRAARKAASGKGCSVPKSQDGWVEAVRQLYVARRLASRRPRPAWPARSRCSRRPRAP
ncbi:MAG: IS110 family transposase [Collinsella aerofaciens]